MMISVTRAALGAAVFAALGLTTPVSAVPVPAGAEASAAAAASRATAPQLESINYVRLYRRLVQAGMLSQVLGYKLTIDAEGRPVDCRFSRDFRMVATERDVCRAFLRSTTFEPARDAQGNPVAGTYEDEIEIASFFQPSR